MNTNTAFYLILLCSLFRYTISAQEVTLKLPASPAELEYISDIFKQLHHRDQQYRGYLQYETTDETILNKIDSLMDNFGISEGLTYYKSLDLSLSQEVKDSIWALQKHNDFMNHIMLRGLIDTYGIIPESLVNEKNYIQTLLLLHPPSAWDVETYHEDYAKKLLIEVQAGRMKPKSYASFYDNMLAKILDKPQLYGTNMRFDFESRKEMPPIITDLDETNQARIAIGLPELRDGDYELMSDQ